MKNGLGCNVNSPTRPSPCADLAVTLPKSAREIAQVILSTWRGFREGNATWDEKNSEKFSPSFLFLRRHVSGHFNLPVTLAGVIDGYFKTFSGFVGNPVRAALTADKGRYIPHDNHAEAEVNGKSSCSLRFGPAANMAKIFCVHGFLRVR